MLPPLFATDTTHLEADVQIVAGAVDDGEEGRGEEPHRQAQHHVLQNKEGLVEVEGVAAQLARRGALTTEWVMCRG